MGTKTNRREGNGGGFQHIKGPLNEIIKVKAPLTYSFLHTHPQSHSPGMDPHTQGLQEMFVSRRKRPRAEHRKTRPRPDVILSVTGHVLTGCCHNQVGQGKDPSGKE